MKTRIDKVTIDGAGQYLVHITQVPDGAAFPALPSGRCLIFARKEEVVAFQNAVPERDSLMAMRDAVKAWVLASPALALVDAAGKTSEDPAVRAARGN